MRKNIKKIIYLLIAIITLPLNVSALSGKVSIVCDKTIIAPKESTSCRITGSSDGFISGLSLTATNSKNVKTSNWIVASGWQGDATSGIIDLYTDINKSGNFNIASFTLTAVSEGTSALNITGDYSDDNFELSSVSGKLNLTIKKNNSKMTCNRPYLKLDEDSNILKSESFELSLLK